MGAFQEGRTMGIGSPSKGEILEAQSQGDEGAGRTGTGAESWEKELELAWLCTVGLEEIFDKMEMQKNKKKQKLNTKYENSMWGRQLPKKGTLS